MAVVAAVMMRNWHIRLFLVNACANLTAEEQAGTATGRYTKTELDELETTLKEYELWLNEWVEKQTMRKSAKVLETHLQHLVQNQQRL
ncbi:hypothetical protein BGW80DRAFT_1467255 [Lactifluus volemus]|nr:hypothetical protein BGW80DRAFT_1467255 [Lactifluus volemus]